MSHPVARTRHFPDVQFIARKYWNRYFPGTRWERGYRWTLNSYMDYTEDFSRNIILSPGDTFIDAGANTGMWTIQASRHYRRVIAIEPTRSTLKILRKNLRINHIRNVTVIPKALSDRVGVTRFYRWPGGHMGNTLLKTPVNYSDDYGEAVETGSIETVSIDSLGAMPDVIKLDVEGAETEAIRGGMQTISKFHPTLVIEIHRKENEQLIEKMLPEYSWERRTRHFSVPGKSEFDQAHIVGRRFQQEGHG